MLKKILIGVAALAVVLIAVVIAQPSTYHVERSIEITAPAAVVWAEVSDFNQWSEWSPWDKMDPTQKNQIEGEPGTVGHSSAWVGEKTGKGKMTVTAVERPTRMAIELEFVEPMASVADTTFVIEPAGDDVKLTWSMDGNNDFVGKAFSLVMDMDEMIGKDFEAGLADIKRIAEENAAKQAAEAVAAAEPTEEETETE